MRWKDLLTESDTGRKRIVKKFLLVPRYFNNEHRWLEFAEIIEVVKMVDVGDSFEWGNYEPQWVEVGFFNE